MTRTQIQLPDDLYAKAKALAARREISLAELTRRGVEHMVSVYTGDPADDWQLPTPRRLGWRGLTPAQLKTQAQVTTAEVSALAAIKARR